MNYAHKKILLIGTILLGAIAPLQVRSMEFTEEKVYNEKVSITLFKILENITEDKGEDHISYYQKRIDECILKGADPNYCDSITPLILLCRTTFKPFRKSEAAWYSNTVLRVALIKHLMAVEGTDVNKSDKFGNTVVHYAVRSGAPVILNTLLQYPEVNLNKQNENGETALMEMLNQLGARLWIDKDDVLKCLNLLVRDSSRLKLDLTNNEGKTSIELLDEFCEKRLPKMKKWFPDLPDIMKEISNRLKN